MALDYILDEFPKDIELKGAFKCTLRPLEATDELSFHEFFLAVPTQERMFIKHRVTEPEVIREWCQKIDLGRNLPLLAVKNGQIIADATLHQQLGGWKRHIGRVSILVHQKVNFEIYYSRAQCYGETKQFDKAEADLKKALESARKAGRKFALARVIREKDTSFITIPTTPS